ncbi:MAG: HyaD/HybD family hydrogenase maturation endopeptidase [Thiovulaceae bacterium]|nr:HyaD/HybD family hydrogenase maturation endopeptidase [Sulfurimonadaceae bacterium]
MKTAVIGVGNIIFKDDGIGVFASRFLEENYAFSGAVDCIDGGTLGIHLLHYYETYERVLILDTISLQDEVGSIYAIPSEELLGLGGHKNTAHEVEVSDMINASLFLQNPAQIKVIGIVPHDIESVAIGLSGELEEFFEPFVAAVLGELAKSGIEAIPKKQTASLREIVQTYQNPQDVRLGNE